MKKVILLIIFVILLVVFAMLITPSTGLIQQINTNSNSSQNPNPNPVTSNNNGIIKAVAAGVRQDGAVTILTTEQTTVIASVKANNWQLLKFNPSNTLLAFLGGSNSQDLYIYNLQTQQLEQQTFYQQTAVGISGYSWLNDSVIYFSQGAGNENWLHRYDYTNKEIKKIFRTFGSLLDFNKEAKQLLFKVPVLNGADWEIYNQEGTNIARVTSATIDSKLSVTKVDFLANSQLLISAQDDAKNTQFITYDYNKKTITPLNLNTDNVDFSRLELLCKGPAINTFFAYKPNVQDQTASIYLLNTNLTSLQLLYSMAWDADPSLLTYTCGNNKFAAAATNNSGQSWQEVTLNKINKLDWALNYLNLIFIN